MAHHVKAVYYLVVLAAAMVALQMMTAWPQQRERQQRRQQQRRAGSEINCLASDPHVATPVVLLTKGRSGSSSTWQILSHLMKRENTRRSKSSDRKVPGGLEDIPGKERWQQRKFLEEHPAGDWLVERMCEMRKRDLALGIAGIKWKPYVLDKPGALAAFAKLRDYPQIKLVRSKRNCLDVVISLEKHIAAKSSEGKLQPHCKVDDLECQQSHMKYSSGMVLPTKSLLTQLRKCEAIEEQVDRVLRDARLPHVRVSYERLYHSDTAEEWENILNFLGRPRRLTMADVRAGMAFAPTTGSFSHNETLANYEEVERKLGGTEFAHLLH